VVTTLRYKSEGPGIDSRCHWVFFHGSSDSTMCPGVDSASENEYQDNPGGKGGRCVRLTIYHLHVPMSIHLWALTCWNPVGLFRPVMGLLYLYTVCIGLCGGTVGSGTYVYSQKHNYIPYSTFTITTVQLHVSAINVGHLQVVHEAPYDKLYLHVSGEFTVCGVGWV